MHTPIDGSNKEASMIISLIRSSTSEQIMKSPSVVPKNLVTIAPLPTFDFFSCRLNVDTTSKRRGNSVHLTAIETID